jgi:hypothetical protein
VTRQTGTSICKRLCFRYRAIVEVMVAIETSVKSPATHPQNETLKDILARNTVDHLTLTFWTYVLGLHDIAGDIEPEERKSHRGVIFGSAVMNQRLRARQERALRGHSARGGALARSLAGREDGAEKTSASQLPEFAPEYIGHSYPFTRRPGARAISAPQPIW